MSETKKKWWKPTLSELIYGACSVVAVVLLAIGLYQMVMTQNVKAREVFAVFLQEYGVWALVVFLAGWLISHVMDHQAHKKAKAARAAGHPYN